jgi:hypothetical protein
MFREETAGRLARCHAEGEPGGNLEVLSMSKLLATVSALAFAGLLALPGAANARDNNRDNTGAGMKNSTSIEVSSARRHRHYRHYGYRHHRHYGTRYGYYGPRYYGGYGAYAYDPYYRPYYSRPGVSVGVGPFGFGFGF